MLSVTDNSQEARGDASLVASTLPISEINLVRCVQSTRASGSYKFISPHLEADELARSENMNNRNIRRIAALSDQDTADARRVVACIEGVPATAKVGIEPTCKVAGRMRRRNSDVAEIAGAVARWNVHAAAERNGEMRIVAADALPLVEDLPCRHGRPRVLVSERDVMVNEIADRLDARPAGRRFIEQLPRDVGKPICFAIPAAEQIEEGLRWKILDCVLHGRRRDHVGQAAVAHRSVGRQAHAARRSNEPAAPVPEAVAVGRDRHGRRGDEVIGYDNIGCPREMRSDHRDQWRDLREVVDHLKTDTDSHAWASASLH